MSTPLDVLVCQDCVLLPAYTNDKWRCTDAYVNTEMSDYVLCCECGDVCEFVAYQLTPVVKG